MSPGRETKGKKAGENEEDKSDRLVALGDLGGSAYLERSQMKKASPSLRDHERRREKEGGGVLGRPRNCVTKALRE